jgi:MFS family permease
VYAAEHGIGVDDVGLLLAARAGAALGARLVMMPALKILGRGRLLLAATLLPAAGFAMLPFSAALPWLFLSMVLIGVGLGVGAPLTLSWVAGRATYQLRASALGLLLSANRLAQLAIPAASAALASSAGVGATFVGMGAVLAAAAAVVMVTEFEHPPAATVLERLADTGDGGGH